MERLPWYDNKGMQSGVMDKGDLALRGKAVLAWLLLGGLAFAAGFLQDSITLRTVSLVVLALVGFAILALPYSWAICLLFVYLGFEGMAKILTAYNPIVHVGVDLLIVALSARWFVVALLKRQFRIPRFPPLSGLLAAHFVWFLIQFANPYAMSLYSSMAGAKIYVTVVLLYFFGYYLSNSIGNIHRFMWVWVGVLVVQVITCLQQSAIGAASVLVISPYYAIPLQKFHGYAFRPFGTTAVAGGASVFLQIGSPFLIYFFLQSKSFLTKAGMVALMPATVLALLVSQVRATFLKAILSSLGFVLISLQRSSAKIKFRMAALIAIAGVVFLVALPKLTERWVAEQQENARAIERTMSLFDFETAKRARQGALERIILFSKAVPLGAGLSRTGAASGKFADLIKNDPFFDRPFFTDNYWAATIVDVGIPGSLILTAILVSILWKGFRASRRFRNPELALLNGVLLTSMFAMCVGLWGAESILYNPDATFFWFFAGVLMRLPELDS